MVKLSIIFLELSKLIKYKTRKKDGSFILSTRRRVIQKKGFR
jgi:hypothetical protein